MQKNLLEAITAYQGWYCRQGSKEEKGSGLVISTPPVISLKLLELQTLLLLHHPGQDIFQTEHEKLLYMLARTLIIAVNCLVPVTALLGTDSRVSQKS
jgi:hypothetical protein